MKRKKGTELWADKYWHESVLAARQVLCPTPVVLGRIPAWLTKTLRRAKRQGLFDVGDNTPLSLLHGAALDLGGLVWFDHWGTTSGYTPCEGVDEEVFVAEPYGTGSDTVRVVKRAETFARALGLRYGADVNSWWYPGWTIRLWFAPHPVTASGGVR